MAELQRLHHDILRDLVRAAFHHQDSVTRPGDAQVEVRGFDLGKGRVDHELAVDASDAHRAHGSAPGDVRDHDRSRGGVDREDIQRMDSIGRKREHDHLHFVAHPVLEQWAQRTVGEARDEDGISARASLAAEERARDLAAGGESLFVLHLKGEEVDALAHTTHRGCSKDDRGFRAKGHGAAGLGGQLASLKGKGLVSNGG